jgi:hypothetical protein
MDWQRMSDTPNPHGEYVCTDQGDEHKGNQDDVPHQHLTEVHEVEERPDAARVEGVLSTGRDSLRVEVLLEQVARKALHGRRHEGATSDRVQRAWSVGARVGQEFRRVPDSSGMAHSRESA